MPAKSPALAFEHVNKRYGGVAAVDACRSRSRAAASSRWSARRGRASRPCSKTVNRLVEPSAGRVTLDGEDVGTGPTWALRRRIGYVFQSIGLFPHLTVAENIAIGPRIADMAPPDVGALLDLVDLPRDLGDRMPDALSGGQRQRVAIARALAPGAKLLLLDEALGALDPVTRVALGERLRDLHRELGLTTMLVTHDMAEALLLADRVLVMSAGRIVADATPAELVAGGGGEAAQALVAVPRRQADAIPGAGIGKPPAPSPLAGGGRGPGG